jgi:hypothetical protein
MRSIHSMWFELVKNLFTQEKLHSKEYFLVVLRVIFASSRTVRVFDRDFPIFLISLLEARCRDSVDLPI